MVDITQSNPDVHEVYLSHTIINQLHNLRCIKVKGFGYVFVPKAIYCHPEEFLGVGKLIKAELENGDIEQSRVNTPQCMLPQPGDEK